MNRGRAPTAEEEMVSRAGLSMFGTLIWTCAAKVLKAPYRAKELSPEEATQMHNCIEKHFNILKGMGQQQQRGAPF